jgi:hypothetical protein
LVGIITVYIGNTVHDSNNSYSVWQDGQQTFYTENN